MRFQSKKELLETIEIEWEKLLNLVDEIPREKMEIPPKSRPGSMEKSGDRWAIKDLFSHIYAWDKMFLEWYDTGVQGESPEVPGHGFTWKEIPELNKKIYEQYREDSVNVALRNMKRGHEGVYNLAKNATEKELLEPGYYSWTKTLPLASYVASSTLSHYRWFVRTVKQILKEV